MNRFQTWVAKTDTEMPFTLLMSWQTLHELDADDDVSGGGGGEQAAGQTGLEVG